MKPKLNVMKSKPISEKADLNGSSKENIPFINHLKKRKLVHMDEFEAYLDLAELDLGDGFNAFDEDFYTDL